MSDVFGAEFYDLGGGLIVDSEGEIVETDEDNPLLLLAARRHDAHEQMKGWDDWLNKVDRVFLKQQMEKRQAYGTVVIDVCGGSYKVLNGEAFADLAWELVEGAEPMVIIRRLLQVIAAGTGFRAAQDKRQPELPYLEPAMAAVYEKAREAREKRPWVQSSVARRPAPAVRIVPNPELRDEVPA